MVLPQRKATLRLRQKPKLLRIQTERLCLCGRKRMLGCGLRTGEFFVGEMHSTGKKRLCIIEREVHCIALLLELCRRK